MLIIPETIWETMITHLRQCWPEEGCGLLGGRGLSVYQAYPGRNAHSQPKRGYLMDAQDLFSSYRKMRDSRYKLQAIFHSHPQTAPEISATDIEQAYYPEAYYLIISLARKDFPIFRNYRIIQGKAKEYPLTIGTKVYQPDPRDE